jgi:hypothetical protein
MLRYLPTTLKFEADTALLRNHVHHVLPVHPVYDLAVEPSDPETMDKQYSMFEHHTHAASHASGSINRI